MKLIIVLFLLTSCALFKTEDAGTYSKSTTVLNKLLSQGNLSPWSANKKEGSDFSLFNNLTKSYFIFNSACRKNEFSNLVSLTSAMFSGINDLNYLEKITTTHQGREAVLIVASGKVDGVTRFFRVLTTQKNNCIYDYVLIAINQATMEKDTIDFNSFTQNIILQ